MFVVVICSWKQSAFLFSVTHVNPCDANSSLLYGRWSGRNHREKIGVHVAFDQVLNIKPYCCTGSGHSVHRGGYTYDLSAVVMHHGKGFGSGHYTAYCYNTEGGEKKPWTYFRSTYEVLLFCVTFKPVFFFLPFQVSGSTVMTLR